jgi:hypothetical protein
MINLNKLFTAIAAVCMLCSSSLYAQTHLKQVVVVSGGNFADPNNFVRLATYNTSTRKYSVIDSIKALSTYAALMDSGMAYYTADTFLVAVDIDKKVKKGTAISKGYTNMALYKNYLLVTRSYSATSNYVQVYNKKTLAFVKNITGISQNTDDIVVVGDSAYVSTPGSFTALKGSLSVIDLKNMVLKREVNLDTMGAGLGRVFSDGKYIYAINWAKNGIVSMNINTGAVAIKYLSSANSIGDGYTMVNDTIYLSVNYTKLSAYKTSTQAVLSKTFFDFTTLPKVYGKTANIAAVDYEPLSKQFFVTTTDYATFGRGYVVSAAGAITDSFRTGISPQAMALDYGSRTAGIEEQKAADITIAVYPNPASSLLYVGMPDGKEATLSITDLNGRVLAQQMLGNGHGFTYSFPVQNLANGVYLLSYRTEMGVFTSKFIKQ